MAFLVAKWEGKEEPRLHSPEWFHRRCDRSLYIVLKKKLEKITRPTEKIIAGEEQIAYAKRLFDIPETNS